MQYGSKPKSKNKNNRSPVCYVAYRLPNREEINILISRQSPALLTSYREVGREWGYVFAPYRLDAQSPLWLIPPDEIRQEQLPIGAASPLCAQRCEAPAEKAVYKRAFARCLAELEAGTVEKIVLSRTCRLRFSQVLQFEKLKEIFVEACRCYPQSFVSLVALPHPYGTWLTITPEILIEAQSDKWYTMALAGTESIRCSNFCHLENWNKKNRREQACVAQYIAHTLRSLQTEFTASPVYVRQAASLLHLCTDFVLPRRQELPLGCLVAALHPTPAVCGMPSAVAQRLLVDVETHDRTYYAGFSGPVFPDAVHLFVTLRCASFSDHHATLYAGGGLLRESQFTTEWQETERKLSTVLRLFQCDGGIPSTETPFFFPTLSH